MRMSYPYKKRRRLKEAIGTLDSPFSLCRILAARLLRDNLVQSVTNFFAKLIDFRPAVIIYVSGRMLTVLIHAGFYRVALYS